MIEEPRLGAQARPLAPLPATAQDPTVWRTALTAALVHGVLAGLCMALSRGGVEVATLWMANAPVVALLVQRQGQSRYALVAVGLVNALANLVAGTHPLDAGAFALANVVSISVGILLLRRSTLTPTMLQSADGLLRVVALGSLLPETIGATVAAVLTTLQGDGNPALIWTRWVQGGWIGGLASLPLACLLISTERRKLWQEVRHGPFLVLLPLCMGGTVLALVHLPYPFVVLAMPLVLAAISVNQIAHAVLVAAVAVVASAAAVSGAFVPAPMQSHWEALYISLAMLAAMLPAQLLSAAVARQRFQIDMLSSQAEALRRANDGLEQFVRIASHDLREPLNTVVQFASLASQHPEAELSAQPRRYLEIVKQAGNRMRSLLDDMLQYARLQREHLGQPGRVELAGLLDEVQLNLAASLRSSGAVLTVDALPAVQGHAWLLRLVFQNLLSNALKFVAEGVSPLVQVSAQRVGGRVFVTVSDNGIGIAAEDQARLFKPFSRLHLRRQYEGTGLGLAMAAEVARLHGGQVTLISEPGRGSHFTVDLPAALDRHP